MTGNNETSGYFSRLTTAISTATEGLRTAGSEVLSVGRDFARETAKDAKNALNTLSDELATEYRTFHYKLALEQGETKEVAAKIADYLVRNHLLFSFKHPSNAKGGPSGPGPDAGAVS